MVSIVNSGTSKCQLVMSLVRALFHVAVRYNFDIRLRHVPGLDNTAADLLSRDEVGKFRALFAGQYESAPSLASRDF